MRLGRYFMLAAGACLALGTVMVLRAYAPRPKSQAVVAIAPIPVDVQGAAERLAGAVRLQTISFDDRPDASAPAFEALHNYLERTYPKAHAAMTREKINGYSLLYTWKGTDASLKPIMLMAHQDVVPVAADTVKDWRYPPFGGVIAEGFVWGRGAWDDKSNLFAIFEALEIAVASGAQPKRTIYVASGHDEEVGGDHGAQAIADLLESRGVQLEFVLDEGSLIADGLVPGVDKPVALIGLAEKGFATLRLTAEAKPGHASMPSRPSAIGAIANAVANLEKNQPPAAVSGLTRQNLELLAPEMEPFNRIMLSNLWLTEPLVRAQLEKKPASNALLRTTVALTVLKSGDKANVIPATAEALVNLRILPGENIELVTQRASNAIADPSVKLSLFGTAREPSPISPMDAPSYKAIERTIREIAPETVVAPNLVIAGTDSRRMIALTPNIYRFLPVRARNEDLARFHGINERIGIENYGEIIRFFHRLIEQTAIAP